ncbi:MAG: hypothetical protein ACF8LL_13030, partial [Phycisphaerales bacterium]
MDTTSRRGFIAAGSVTLVAGVAYAGTHGVKPSVSNVSNDFVRAENDRVRAFVGACHAQIDAVREMLRDDPDLAKSSWDWGFGDYETA